MKIKNQIRLKSIGTKNKNQTIQEKYMLAMNKYKKEVK